MICGWLPILKKGRLRKTVVGELEIRQHRLILAVENQSPSRICQTCRRHTNAAAAASAYSPMMLFARRRSYSALACVFHTRIWAAIETRTAIRTAVALARFIHSQ